VLGLGGTPDVVETISADDVGEPANGTTAAAEEATGPEVTA
jgi:hypothetical protein